MSLIGNNILYNGNFDSFDINTDDYIYYGAFTTDQSNNFCWTCSGDYVSLQNGNTVFGYSDPSGVTPYTYQFASFQYTASISQVVTIPSSGTYQLSFNYSIRDGYELNQLQIIMNSTVIDTLLVSPPSWIWGNYETNIHLYSGNQLLKFQGQDLNNSDNDIAICNISLVLLEIDYHPPANFISPASTSLITNGSFTNPTLATNSYKKMNVSGASITNWTYSAISTLALCNGNTYGFTYPTSTQFIFFYATTGYLSQSVNFSQLGTYNLSFDYAKTSNYNCNYLNILLNGTSITTTPTSYSTTWNTFSCQIPISIAGLNTIKFQALKAVSVIGITNILLYFAGGGTGGGGGGGNNNKSLNSVTE